MNEYTNKVLNELANDDIIDDGTKATEYRASDCRTISFFDATTGKPIEIVDRYRVEDDLRIFFRVREWNKEEL